MKRIIFSAILIVFLYACATQPKGKERSVSSGSVSNGKLINGRKFAFKGENYRYFSPLSYSILNRAWVHSKVFNITNEAYHELMKLYPEKRFLLMECSKKKGGKVRPHQTHQNGTSIDFGTPLLKKNKPYNFHHCYGIFHYLMRFDSTGKLKGNKKVIIDFNTIAHHIILLDKAARKRGMYVKKVILKTDLIDDLYKTTFGKQVKRKGIYFPKRLSKTINQLHDDHYHIDFGFFK